MYMYAGKFVCVDVCIYHVCMYVCMYVCIYMCQNVFKQKYIELPRVYIEFLLPKKN